MKKRWSIALAMTVAAGLAQAQVTWDGDTDALLNTAANWSDDTAPSDTNDYVVGNNNNLAFSGAWANQLEGNTSFGSITFNTNGGGKYGLRAGSTFGRFLMSGDMTFSSTMGVTEAITVMDSGGGTLNWAAVGVGDKSIINNSGQRVEFGNGSLGFAFSGWLSTGQTLQFGGNSDFELTSSVTFNDTTGGSPRRLNRLWTDGAYSGTVTIRDGNLVNLGTDLRAQGGTIKIEGTDTIKDAVALSLADAGFGTEVNVAGLSDDMFDLNGFGGGDLRVDGTTAVLFDDLRVTAGTIDILDWSEENSSIVFTDLGRQFYGGTIAEGAAIDGMTIGGNTAYLTASGSDWAISSIPEPGTVGLVAVFGGFMVWIRRVFLI